MQPDLVLGIDSSTQSTKAIAWTPDGVAVAEGRAPVPMTSPHAGWFEQDPGDWWAATAAAVRQLWEHVDPHRIAGVAVANQRETLGFLGADDEPVRPALVWLDERGRETMPGVVTALGADTIHRLTGKPPDLTPALYRVAWVRDHEPEIYRRTARFVEVHAYLTARLTGRRATSWCSADPIGLFEIEAKRWSPDILAHLRIALAQLPEIVAPGTLLGGVTEPAAAATGLLAKTPVFAAGGDGQCAGVGTGSVTAGHGYLNLGTALVAGVWSARPVTALDWRTLTSATGAGYVLETVQRTGTFLLDWLVRNVAGHIGPTAHAELEAEAAKIPIGSDGLLTLPTWSGAMDPNWDSDARGCFVGLGSSHGVAHLFRSITEGLTLEFSRGLAAMARAGVRVDDIVVIGGGARSRLWTQMVADATGHRVCLRDVVEASALGAGMIAAHGAGWYPSIEAASAGMGGASRTVVPDPVATARYRDLLAIHGTLYDSNKALFVRLAQFRASG